MEREQIKSQIVEYFRQQLKNRQNNQLLQIQMGNLFSLFDKEVQKIASYLQKDFYSLIKEIVHELIIGGLLYPGQPDQNSDYPWLTITTFGKEAFLSEDWMPYDPEGYVKVLQQKAINIDPVTLTYVSESVAAFNWRHLLSANITLGVASENLMLNLIEVYANWLTGTRKVKFEKKIKDRSIYTKYKEFKNEFKTDVNNFHKDLQQDWETYLEGIFNFIRLNRNSSGHPTGKKLDPKIMYGNLQMFGEYAAYITRLINHLS